MLIKKTASFLTAHLHIQKNLPTAPLLVRTYNSSVMKPGEFLRSKKDVLLDMHIREPKNRYDKTHPEKQKWIERMTAPSIPLNYKLLDVEVPMGFFPKLQGVNTDHIPFEIERTQSGNLPVYRDYKNGRNTKYTEVRLVTGDIDAFCKELSKICSNCSVNPKVGRVVISGLHKVSVSNWLYRLGF
jgi:hypothetical protein